MESNMNIYVVMGSTGEYADQTSWSVNAFKTKRKAKAFINKCTKEYLRIRSLVFSDYPEDTKDNSIFYRRWNMAEYPNAVDPNMRLDYTGVEYSFYVVELIE